MTRALRFAAVLLAAAWVSAPSEVAAQIARRVTAVTLNSPASGDTFKRNETITVTVTFNQIVANQNSCGGANPLRLEVQIGANTRNFSCPTGSGINHRNHVFSYVVQAGDMDADGISIAAGALVGGQLVNSGSGQPVADRSLGTHAITNSANHKVDDQFAAGASGVVGVALNTPVLGGTFERGEVIEATLTFNTAVDVTGTPQVGLGIGSNTRQANYVGGTGTTALRFRYTVVTADVDSNGVSITATALGLNSGTIRTAGTTTNTYLGLSGYAISDSANHQVNGGTLTPTAVSDVSIISTPARHRKRWRATC